MTDFTQHYRWGNCDAEHKVLMDHGEFSDEYFWEHTTPEDVITHVIGLNLVNQVLEQGGGWLITDRANPLPRFHIIEIWCYHPDARKLNWFSLQK